MYISNLLTLLVASFAMEASASCAYGTLLQPRAEGGAVKVNTFGYMGAKGPANWTALDPAVNALCSTGTRQSPIDLVANASAMIPGSQLGLSIPDMPQGTDFENLGTTVEVVAQGGNMSFRGVQYSLKQFHFHLPSEHLDNGGSMAMEMHMVWQGSAAEVAVIGAFIDLDDGGAAGAKVVEKRLSRREARPAARKTATKETTDASRLPGIDKSFFHVNAPKTAATSSSTLLETVLGSVEQISTPGTAIKTPALTMSELVNTLVSGSFRTYEGSLTTPPCSEGVRWLVSDQTLTIKTATYVKSRSVIGFNSRFPQNRPGEPNVLAGN